jgi:hypothetical protein
MIKVYREAQAQPEKVYFSAKVGPGRSVFFSLTIWKGSIFLYILGKSTFCEGVLGKGMPPSLPKIMYTITRDPSQVQYPI